MRFRCQSLRARHLSFPYPSSPSDKSAVIVRRISPLLSARGAAHLGWGSRFDRAEQTSRETFRTVEAGVLPDEYLAEPQMVDQSLSDASARVSIRSDQGVQIDELVVLAPDDVESPVEVTPYIVAPGDAGFRQLIAQRAIFDEKWSEFQATVAIWNEARSKPYRSRFDPDFTFPNPQISHFIAKSIGFSDIELWALPRGGWIAHSKTRCRSTTSNLLRLHRRCADRRCGLRPDNAAFSRERQRRKRRQRGHPKGTVGRYSLVRRGECRGALEGSIRTRIPQV